MTRGMPNMIGFGHHWLGKRTTPAQLPSP
jgi:hypothetical protein